MNGAGPHTGTGCRRRGALGLVLRGARGGEHGTTRCARLYLRAALRAGHEASERIPRGQRSPISSFLFFFFFPAPPTSLQAATVKASGSPPFCFSFLSRHLSVQGARGSKREQPALSAPCTEPPADTAPPSTKWWPGPRQAHVGAGPSAWGCAYLEAPRSIPNGKLPLSISGPGRSLGPAGDCRSEGRQEVRPGRPEP